MAPVDTRPATAINYLRGVLDDLAERLDGSNRSLVLKLARAVRGLPRNDGGRILIAGLLEEFIQNIESEAESRLIQEAFNSVSEHFKNNKSTAITQFVNGLNELTETDDTLAHLLQTVIEWLGIISQEQEKMEQRGVEPESSESGSEDLDEDDLDEDGAVESGKMIQTLVENIAWNKESIPAMEELRHHIQSMDAEQGLRKVIELVNQHLKEASHSKKSQETIKRPKNAGGTGPESTAAGSHRSRSNSNATQTSEGSSQSQTPPTRDENMSDYHTSNGSRRESPGQPDQYIRPVDTLFLPGRGTSRITATTTDMSTLCLAASSATATANAAATRKMMTMTDHLRSPRNLRSSIMSLEILVSTRFRIR